MLTHLLRGAGTLLLVLNMLFASQLSVAQRSPFPPNLAARPILQSATGAEIIDLRDGNGSLKSARLRDIVMDERLSRVGQLTKWRTGLAKMRVGGYWPTAVFAGDSIAAGAGGGTSANGSGVYTGGSYQRSRPAYFAQMLAARGIAANYNCWFGVHNYNTLTEFNSIDSRFQLGSAVTVTAFGSLGGNQYILTNSANGTITITPSGTVDRVTVFYSGNAGLGSYTLSDGGVDVVTQATAGANALVKVTHNLTTRAAGKTLVIRNATSPAASAFVAGVIVWDSQTPAVNVINAGMFGARASQVAVTANVFDYANALAFVAPDLTFIQFGGNEVINAAANNLAVSDVVATYTTSIQLLIDKAKATGSVVLDIPPPGRVLNGVETLPEKYYAPIRTAIGDIARSNNLILQDMWTRMGDWDVAQANGLMSDATHPSAIGYADYALDDANTVVQ